MVPRSGATLSLEEFGRLFAEHRGTFWCIAASVLSSRAHAEDVLQEAATIAIPKLDQFDPATSFAAWVGQIVRFVALNELRRRQRHASVDPSAIDGAVAPERLAPRQRAVDVVGRLVPEQSAFDDHVSGALGELDEVARACLLLRTVRDLPYNEISAIMGIPEGTAMSHVHRARAAMRRSLTEKPEKREARA